MNPMTKNVVVHPAGRLGGSLEVPGDKSISHRIAMLSGFAAGESVVENYLKCEDCMNTLKAMVSLGARTFYSEEGHVVIQGTGGRVLQPAGALDLGNSGTGIRLLAGLLAGLPLTVEMTGDESLRSRPMQRIREPLERMGAQMELTGEKGCPPVRLQGGRLKGIEYILPVASAQVKSAILLATLHAEGRTVITEPRATRDHTERLLRMFGLPVRVEGLSIELEGCGPKGPALKGRRWRVPGDFSSAAFWMAAVAARPDAEATIRNVGLNPRRTALLDVLRRMGAQVEARVDPASVEFEPCGTVSIRGAALRGTEVGGAEIPNLIDELPLVAVLGALAQGETRIRDAAELRVKESDRIACMAANLRLMGVEVEEQPDGMTVRGPAAFKLTGEPKSYGDHRIAMAMAVLATHGPAPVCIHNVACVDTSYPAFWQDLEKMGGHCE